MADSRSLVLPGGVLPGRRRLLAFAGALACGGCTPQARPSPALVLPPTASGQSLLDDLERRTFDFFWQTANPVNGLVPDRYPSPSAASIAAVGFALTAYPIGVERGWITRAQARDRVLATLQFFAAAAQGPQSGGMTGYQGFFYHFLHMSRGTRAWKCELSTVDTALLLAGVLFCQSWFDQAISDEVQIRQLADAIYTRVNWTWAQPRAPLIAMGWTPEHGFIKQDWCGYNEAMIVYLLALGSPVHEVEPAAWPAWCSTYDASWGTFEGYEHLGFAPLFGHQYSHVWVDFRGIADPYMRARGIDYFENSRRATYSQRAYAISNPGRWKGYDDRIWGLSACDGPHDGVQPYQGVGRRFRGYAARGAGLRHTVDDGTIAPTAMLASLPFAPEIVLPSLHEMVRRHGALLYTRYGLLDAFNPTFDYPAWLEYGRLAPGFGWVDTDYVGIDQGPILAMIANYRKGFVWKVMRNNANLVRGLRRAGFDGGWLGSGKTAARR
ncbi:MAG TPA: glucoamylase family protein [Burkholderiaceae bacterium]|nr:glucoamylase family protein [Burkholderiaceae bacterium]